MSKVVKNIRS